MAPDALPDYELMLASYHTAFASELEAMVGTLSIVEGSRILEMACGDGAYTGWLAQRAGREGQVVGLDVSKDYLRLSRQETQGQTQGAEPRFVAATIERLPFSAATFDMVWCAQSLFSLPEPVEAVAQMASVVKPGGTVAVLEDDSLHRVLLPWPVEVELAVRAAEYQVLTEKSDHPDKFYVGRQLVGVFREAGLVDISVRSFASSRVAPLDSASKTFLTEYLRSLTDRVGSRLDEATRSEYLRWADPESREFLVDQPDLLLTVVDHVVQGRVVAG